MTLTKQNEIPAGWKETTLGEVLDIRNGKSRPKDGVKYPVYGGNGVLGYADEYNVDEKIIIVGRVGAYCGCIFFEKEKFWLSDNALGVLAKENANIYFLYYLLKKINLNKQAIGGAQPLLTQGVINQIEALIPEKVEEQRAIAVVLSALDDKIELLHEQNKTLEATAQTIFKEWFIKFEVNGQKLKVNSKTGLPEGWRMGKIGEELSITIGGDWGEETKSNSDDVQAYCLRGTDIDSLKLSGYSAQVPIRWIRKDSLEKRAITENDILIGGSGLGPIGKTVYCHRNINLLYGLPITYSNFCKRFTAKNKYYALYFEYLISALYSRGALERFSIGTSIPNLDINGLLEEIVIIPMEKHIEDFSKILDLKYSKLMNPQIQTLSKLRDALLPKLMRGEIRVKY